MKGPLPRRGRSSAPQIPSCRDLVIAVRNIDPDRISKTHFADRLASTAAPVIPALSPNLEAMISTPFIVPGMA